jgi:GntR family transcriptional repressor for pyruvate dehydrogenase complex
MATDTEPEPTTAAKPGFSLPSAPRESLSSRSAVILKRYLLAEGLQPGDRLPPERRLAEALNVSRTVLREAINQLVGEGLVTREASRSPVVTDFDRARVAAEMSMLAGPDAEIRDLIELRVMVELGAIEAIVERASDDDVAEMERWVAEGERRVQEGKPMAVADLRFHAALLRSLGNRAVDALLPLIEENMRENLLIDTHELSGQHTATDDRVIGQHRRILEAVRARDPQAAREAMREHLDPYLHPPAAD